MRERRAASPALTALTRSTRSGSRCRIPLRAGSVPWDPFVAGHSRAPHPANRRPHRAAARFPHAVPGGADRIVAARRERRAAFRVSGSCPRLLSAFAAGHRPQHIGRRRTGLARGRVHLPQPGDLLPRERLSRAVCRRPAKKEPPRRPRQAQPIIRK